MSSQQRSLADPRPDEHRILHEADLRDYLAGLPAVAARLGGAPASWSVSEVGDGNLNLVFIVKGAAGGVTVKQALPYVRLVGESWPLPLSRSHYEYLALTHQVRLAPGLVPAVLHHNEALHPRRHGADRAAHRHAQGAGCRDILPALRRRHHDFSARTLFLSSDLAVSAAEKKEGIAAFAGNHALCKITEDLIFTDPYREAEQNRWTQPWLDATAAAFREDLDLHVAISLLKVKFMASPEALIHGDLHTGSIMVTDSSTMVIDPEFAFYGPMGFDIGAVIANLLMSYLASIGHERSPGERRSFEAWVLETVESVWTEFTKFLELWRTEAKGDAYPATLFEGDAGAARLETERLAYMERLLQRHGRVLGRKNHPPHSGPGAQYRFRMDRGSQATGDQRGAEPAARACDDGGCGLVPHDRCRHQSGAGGARLAAGFRQMRADLTR